MCLSLGCGDQYRPVANPIIQPTGNPQQQKLALAVFQDTSSTCEDGSAPPCKGATSQIDVSGDSSVATVYVGRTPVEAILGSQVVVADYGDSAISSFSLQSPGATPTTVPTSSAPTSLALGSSAYFVTGSAPCPNNSSGGCVTVLPNTDTGQTLIPVGANPVAVAVTPDGSAIYVANQGQNTISIFSTADYTPIATGMQVGSQPSFILANPTTDVMYVLNRGDATISVIDAFTNALLTTALLDPQGVNPNYLPNYMVFNSQLQRLYVANAGTGTVSVLDASNTSAYLSLLPALSLPSNAPSPGLGIAPLAAVPTTLPASPATIAPLADGSRVYVLSTATTGCHPASEPDRGQVWFFNTSNNSVGGCISVGANPVAIASSSDSTKVYVAHQGTLGDPNNLPADAVPPGISIISVADNNQEVSSTGTTVTAMTNVSAPNVNPNCPSVDSADPNCGFPPANPVVNPATGLLVPVLMTPVFVTSQ
jgi:YVTN family beta-propeller protein